MQSDANLSQNFPPRDKVVCAVTKRIYDCAIPPGIHFLKCNSSKITFLITRDLCHLQYLQ